MKKSQSDLLHRKGPISPDDPLLAAPPKTPQQFFLHSYLALQLLPSNQEIPYLHALVNTVTGSFSQLLLYQRFMKNCMEKGESLDNPKFRVLNTLILWMGEMEKIKDNSRPNLVASILLPHPNQLLLYQYEELILYFNYVAGDVQKIMKEAKELEAIDLLQLLEVLLPRVYYNVIISPDSLGKESTQTQDILFYNQSLEYFIRTNTNYRALCKYTLKHLLTLQLTQNQMRELIERTCRYYLLFIKDTKQSTEFFMAALEKATEAARFSLTDEFVLFFKVIGKLGDRHLQNMVRGKYGWIDELLNRYGQGSIIGHPKGEVNPFNVLGIKQSVRVDARKTTSRIIEIYNEYSLFYFKIELQDHDITFRLFYLGEFQSKVEVKKLLLTHEKVSEEIRSAFVAAKKGIYMIEFDNSYSWLNGKNLKFEYVLLDQYKEHNYPLWMKNLFAIKEKGGEKGEHKASEEVSHEGKKEEKREEEKEEKVEKTEQIPSTYEDTEKEEKHEEKVEVVVDVQSKVETQVIHEEELSELPVDPIEAKQQTKEQLPQQTPPKLQPQPIDNKPSSSQIKSSNSLPSHQSQPIEWGQANLSLIDSIFSLLVDLSSHTYEFQTNLQDRITKRLRSYCQGQQNLNWTFNSEARDWLKRKGFFVSNKNGRTFLFLSEGKKRDSMREKEEK